MSNHGPSAELLQLLENLPPDEPRSKLEPFRAIILRWRGRAEATAAFRRFCWSSASLRLPMKLCGDSCNAANDRVLPCRKMKRRYRPQRRRWCQLLRRQAPIPTPRPANACDYSRLSRSRSNRRRALSIPRRMQSSRS